VAHIGLYAPLVAFENSKNSKTIKNTKNTKKKFENHKNMKKLLYFNFLRILAYEEHFQITPNFLTSR
jgi:hypothetical protein